MELTERKIKKIPYQSLGVLTMHMMGIDVRKKMARGTYYSHRRILQSYGYDITPEKKQASKQKK